MSERADIRTTGIVVALASEASTLTSRTAQPNHLSELGDGAALWLSGMGPIAARRAAQELADSGSTALAVFGVAGALSVRLRNGALFCPEHVLDGQNEYAADPQWRNQLQKHLVMASIPLHTEGVLLSVETPLLTTSAKTDAHALRGALAVDMESAAVAAVARERGLPFVALRAIIDEVGDTIPDALNEYVDAWGRPRPLPLIAALCRHPSVLVKLPQLYLRMQSATRALRAAAKATGPTLGWRR